MFLKVKQSTVCNSDAYISRELLIKLLHLLLIKFKNANPPSSFSALLTDNPVDTVTFSNLCIYPFVLSSFRIIQREINSCCRRKMRCTLQMCCGIQVTYLKTCVQVDQDI